MKEITQMTIKLGLTVEQLIREMDRCGVLGAGRLARAVDIIVEMFKDPDYTVFLSLAGPMILGGLRKIVGGLIEGEYINAIITSGGNVVHDIMEALGYGGIKGSYSVRDVELRDKGLGRVGDIYIEKKGFEALEKKIHPVLEALPYSERGFAIYELLHEIGKTIEDGNSILQKASTHDTPIFSPGILDSMVGLNLWTYSQLKEIRIDPLLDLNKLAEMIFNSKKVGVIILGGGLPKHFALGANTLRDGVDAAVQITLDRPEGGSLSGAPLEEAISWGKVKREENIVTVIGDCTIVFPIIVAATWDRLEMEG